MARITEGRRDVDPDLLCENCGHFPCDCVELKTKQERKEQSDKLQEKFNA